MTTELQDIQRAITKYFSSPEHNLDKQYFRTRLESSGSTIAIYYFDYSKSPLEASFDIDEYQDSLIAEDYYRHPSSLQWNFNLIFLITEEEYTNFENSPRKREIESNPSYCRKQVLTVAGLKDIFPLHDAPILSGQQTLGTDISIRWTQKLEQAGIGFIASDMPKSKVVTRILNADDPASPKDTSEQTTLPEESAAGPGPQIENIDLLNYRKEPRHRQFSFSKVNLLPGPNGVGKTSLLEAIELCYCGKTARSGPEDGHRISYQFKSNGVEILSPQRDSQFYRDRDLHWYRNRYTRGNVLHQSFNKFNFFDTDQGFQLKKADPNKIRVAFNSLALGQNATFLDSRIRDIRHLLQDEDRKLGKQHDQLYIRVKALRVEIADLKSISDQTGPLWEVVEEEFRKLKWQGVKPEKIQGVLGALEGILIQVRTTIEEIRENVGEWVSPLSVESLKKRQSHLLSINKDVKVFEDQAKKMANEFLETSRNSDSIKNITHLYTRLNAYVNLDGWEKIDGLSERIELVKVKISNRKSARTRLDPLRKKLQDTSHVLLAELCEKREDELASAEKLSFEISKAIEDLKSRSTERDSLKAELHDISQQLLESTNDPGTCPLCRAHYKGNELKERIGKLLDTAPASQELAGKLKTKGVQERTINIAKQKFQSALQLRQIAEEYIPGADSDSLTVGEVQGRLNDYSGEIDILEHELEASNSLLNLLKGKGLGENEYQQIIEDLKQSSAAFISGQISRESVTTKLSSLSQDLDSARNAQANSKRVQRESEQHLFGKLGNLQKSPYDIENAISLFRSNTSALATAIEGTSYLQEFIDFDATHDINRLFEQVNRTLAQLKELKVQLSSARSTDRNLAGRMKDLERDEPILKEVDQKLGRLSRSLGTLEDIVKNDNLDMALNTFIDEYKDIMLAIFRAIHLPREFDDINIGDSEITLRKPREGTIPLNRISTGQRAALALSIFLGLNSSLTSGPSIILLDDPIANVDDINCLAFLDFLRGFVVERDRQLFFATADRKIANLVEKKFDFLGKDFRPLDI